MDKNQKNTFDKRLFHKKLYKNARGRTPPWKEVYRKRCMDRLRSNRSQLVEHFRSAGDAINNNNNHLPTVKRVQDVMEVEWVAMSPGTGFPLVSQDDFPENEQALFSMMEEIQQELLSEEEKIIMDVLNYDASALASQVSLQSEEVICPVCQVQGLQESPHKYVNMPVASGDGAGANLLVCGCGLALQGANLTLNTVKSSLENTVSHHGQTCTGRMSFTSTTDTHGANVLIMCSVCDWMSFLL